MNSQPLFWTEIRALMLAAMAVFLYTIVIGILNGADLVEFDQRRILGHVHGGTLGWLTLSVFAASLWLFGDRPGPTDTERTIARWATIGAIVVLPAYVAAFSRTYGWWRPILGTVSVIVIAAYFAWVGMRFRKVELGVPHWGFLAALGTSIVGGVLGVLLGLEIATGDNWLPEGGEGAHPATMVVGFLIPVALSMAEWAFFFPNPPKATRIGIIQMVFPFVGGVLLMISLLFEIVPLAPIAVLLEIVGLGIFLKRMWPSLRGVNWSTANPGRHAVVSTAGIIFVIGLAQYFIIRYEGDFDLVPPHQLLALDHVQFIGAMTNAILAMLLAATVAGGRGKRADQVVFVVINVGISGFAAGLLFDVTELKRIFAPLMGAGLLFALGLYAMRLTGSAAENPPVRDAEASAAR